MARKYSKAGGAKVAGRGAAVERSDQVTMGDSTYPGPLGRANSIIAAGTDQSPAQTGYAGQALAAQLLAKIFKHLNMCVAVRLWSGPAFRVGGSVPAEAGAAGARAERVVPSRLLRCGFGRLRPWSRWCSDATRYASPRRIFAARSISREICSPRWPSRIICRR